MVRFCMDPCNRNPLTGSHPPRLLVTVEPAGFVAKENMMTAPGAVQASQLIPEQAIGC